MARLSSSTRDGRRLSYEEQLAIVERKIFRLACLISGGFGVIIGIWLAVVVVLIH